MSVQYPDKDFNEVAQAINNLKTKLANNLMEIGQRLLEVREKIPHGKWSGWLEEKVGLSSRQALNYITAYRYCLRSNRKSTSDLGLQKLAILAQLPESKDVDAAIEKFQPERKSVRQIQAFVKSITRPDDDNSGEVSSSELTSLRREVEVIKGITDPDGYRHVSDIAKACVRIENYIERHLAPTFFSEALISHSLEPAVIGTLRQTVDRVDHWVSKMNEIIENNSNVLEVHHVRN